jgi:phosphomannomutase
VKQLKISGSWIRGVVGDGLTPELATDFACAFGTWLDEGEVVLARDTRRSSPLFMSAVIAGLISTGCDVANAGVCPAPVAQFLVKSRGARGGIVVAGGQNDSDWNALKFINADGVPLNGIQAEELLDLYHLGEFSRAGWESLGRERLIGDFVEPFLDDILSRLDVDAIRRANFRVVVDLCNGTAGSVIGGFLSRLGCRPVLINEEPAGDFAHPPAPTRRNMRQLASLLKHIDADVGFAFNTDADHVGLVTEAGEALSEEYAFPLVADHVLSEGKALAVTNLSTSRMIEKVIAARDGRLIRTKIGEGNVIFTAVNEDAVLAGEGSGGVACLALSSAFDGFLTVALILEAMARSGCRISELRDRLPSFHREKGIVPAASGEVYHALEVLRTYYAGGEDPSGLGEATLDLTDGVRLVWPLIWLHVRASNTEPVLRIIVEGEDQERVESLFSETMRRVNAVVQGKL